MATEKVTLAVKGMHCGSCAQRVQRALSKVKGVTGATVDLAAEQATVEITPGSTTVSALRQAVRDIGFQAPE